MPGDLPPKTILLASPRGFCAGVVRAIDIVDLALDCFGTPLYVRREIVHNLHVVRGFEERGVTFVEELGEVPDGATVMFSAHGVSPAVRAAAAARRLKVLDATCPLVTKVHLEALRFARLGYRIFLIGHPGHEEVVGTIGEAAERIALVSSVEDVERIAVEDPDRVAFITQTTLSVEDTRPIIEALRRPLSGDPEPGKRRHLLRDAEPAVRRTRAGEGSGRHPGRGIGELLELKAPGGGGRARGRARLSRGRRFAGRAALARRRDDGRRDFRSLRSRVSRRGRSSRTCGLPSAPRSARS